LSAGTTVFLASSTVEEFWISADRLLQVNPALTPAWWPVLEKSYWVSPFTTARELDFLHREINRLDSQTEVLIDLELPLLRPLHFFSQLSSFSRNKAWLSDFVRDERVICAEYPRSLITSSKLLRALGVSFKSARQRLVMSYTSMIPLKLRQHFRAHLVKAIEDDPHLCVGIGTLGNGVLKREPPLTDQELEADLRFCQTRGVRRVIVFRLGGATLSQLAILGRFSTNVQNPAGLLKPTFVHS
jgi:hypothetical protein